MKKKVFIKKFNLDGSVIVKNILDKKSIDNFKKDIEVSINKEVKYHGTKNYSYYGYVLSNINYGGEFLKIFDNKKLTSYFDCILGSSCIVYSMTSSSMPPKSGNNSSKIHIDAPIFSNDIILRMGVIIALDEFKIENGCTTYLPKSHKIEKMPTKSYYNKNKKFLKINAGDAWFFNCRLWHSGGKNITPEWRHAITINMCRPWMKQRLDIPELIKCKTFTNKITEQSKQKLGFYSVVPKSYNEYYSKTTKRIFI